MDNQSQPPIKPNKPIKPPKPIKPVGIGTIKNTNTNVTISSNKNFKKEVNNELPIVSRIENPNSKPNNSSTSDNNSSNKSNNANSNIELKNVIRNNPIPIPVPIGDNRNTNNSNYNNKSKFSNNSNSNRDSHTPTSTPTHTPMEHSTNIIIDKSNYDKMSTNKIYDKVCIADTWVLIFVTAHIIQFSILIVVGYPIFTNFILIILVIMAMAVPVCIIYGRYLVKSKKIFDDWSVYISKPEDEAILNLPTHTIYLFCVAAMLEGLLYAIFSSFVAGNTSTLDSNHFLYNKSTLLETFRFSSIVLFCLHRIIRPANRLDPVRTMLEVSIVRCMIV